MSTLGEEPLQVSHSRDTGVMDIQVPSSREDVKTGRNIIGLVGNKMYATDSDQQAGHKEQPATPTQHEETEADAMAPDDCDDDPDSHTYNYIDDDQDDINNLRQASQDIQPADEEGDTTQPSSDQQSGSHTTNNENYVPAALRQGNNNGI
ncbi:hypothetical protein Bbelb_200110 [Branchiostoma belcheri]|nr:hypothetical protein Bbelb_200110 [Branchiostoma belcheri]